MLILIASHDPLEDNNIEEPIKKDTNAFKYCSIDLDCLPISLGARESEPLSSKALVVAS